MILKKYAAILSIIGALAIVLGAFAAHGLKKKLSENALQSFETGVKYQMYQVFFGLMIIVLPWLSEQVKTQILNLNLIGILLFSGSIYLLCIGLVPSKYLWFVTPMGGLVLITAWAYTAYKLTQN